MVIAVLFRVIKKEAPVYRLPDIKNRSVLFLLVRRRITMDFRKDEDILI